MDGIARELDGRLEVVRLDVSSAVGREAAAHFQVSALPTFVLVDGDGQPVLRLAGMPNRGQIVQELERLEEIDADL